MAVVNLFGALALDSTLQAVRDFISSVIGTRGSVTAADAKGFAALATRHDSDNAVVDDGDYSMLHTDEENRLKVASKPASFTSVVGTANTVAATVPVDVSRASNVMFHVKNVGSVTLAAGTFIFEGSLDSTNGTDGTWFGIQAIRSNANTIETSIALSGMAVNAGYAAAWEASVNAVKWLRIRCSVAVTASASAQWTIIRGTYATEPIPGAQVSGTQAVSGTITSTPLGASMYSAITTGSATILANLKSSSGSLTSLVIRNRGASTAYVKLYNKASAPVVATDIPILTIEAVAGSLVQLPLGALGQRFTTGVSLGCVGLDANTDATNPVANVQILAAYF